MIICPRESLTENFSFHHKFHQLQKSFYDRLHDYIPRRVISIVKSLSFFKNENKNFYKNFYVRCVVNFIMAFSRFKNLSDAEKRDLVSNSYSSNTSKTTNVAWNTFIAFCTEKKLNVNIDTCTKNELDEILKDFYVSARKTDGNLYKKSSFHSLRWGLQRRVKEKRENVDIINDPEFCSSNRIFNAQCMNIKKQGLAKVDHKPPISKGDFEKLYSTGTLSNENPTSLQYKVFFEIMLHFCRRGQENLRLLKISDFSIKSNDSGIRYIVKEKDELTKNRRENDEAQEGGIMLETGKENCPVKSFLKYLEKLNKKCIFLFQRPKVRVIDDNTWYDNMVVGVNNLQAMMKKISEKAELSQIYTNHSIRATSITLLDHSGLEARHIMSVSGHKSESSLKSYARTNLETKEKMSTILSGQSNPIFDLGVNFPNIAEETVHNTNNERKIPSYFEQPTFNNCTINFNH